MKLGIGTIWIWVLFGIVKALVREDLLTEMENCEKMIGLLEEKVRLLRVMYEEQFGDDKPWEEFKSYEKNVNESENGNLMLNLKKQAVQKNKLSSKLMLLNHFNDSVIFLPPHYLLHSNKIQLIDFADKFVQFMGQILAIEPNQLTTLIGHQISTIDLKFVGGEVQKSEQLLGLMANDTSSKWHKSYSSKYQDILLQYKQNSINLISKNQFRQIWLDPHQTILHLFSLNQYKMLFLTNSSYGVINTRSLQIVQHVFVNNISKKSGGVKIVHGVQGQGVVFMLLSSGEIVRYVNQRFFVQDLSFAADDGTFIDFVHPFLFVAETKSSKFHIYNYSLGKFNYWTAFFVSSEHHYTVQQSFDFFKWGDSYRLLHQLSNTTYYFELLIRAEEEQVSYGGYTLKIICVLIIVAIFVYFKFGKQDDKFDEQLNRRRIQARRKEMQVKKQGREAKVMGEVEHFLKKEKAQANKKL